MPKPELIRKRLQKLDEYLAILRKLRRYNLVEFVADPEHYGSAERFMQLAIEVCNDLGNHVVAELGLGRWIHTLIYRRCFPNTATWMNRCGRLGCA